MSMYSCNVSLIGHDYDELSSIVESYNASQDGNEWGDVNPSVVIEKALVKLLENANKKEANVFINRGSERQGEAISLFAKFKSSNSNKNDVETEESEIEYIETEESGNDNLRAKDKDSRGKRLNGIIGVISGSEIIDIKGNTDVPDSEDVSRYNINIELRIKSRMDRDDNYFFLYSLLNLNRNISHNRKVFSSEDEMFDYLLIDVFADAICQVIPKGHYRCYQRFEQNNDRLKGTISIANHIKNNMGNDNGCIYYSYRENTAGNYFNALLLRAYEYLKEKYPDLVEEKLDSDVGIKDYLIVLKYQITDVFRIDTNTLLMKNLRPIAHPFYSEYEELRKLCFYIFRDLGLSLFDETGKNEVRGFLYYLPDLWEQFLEECVKSELKKNTFLNPKEKQITRKYYGGDSRPDYSFSIDPESKETFLILDAKFIPDWVDSLKHKTFSRQKNNIDKCIRDMVAANALATGVVFPIASNEWDSNDNLYEDERIKRELSCYNTRQYFYTFPVVIPMAEDGETYLNWEKRFKEVFLSAFKNKLYSEIDLIRKEYSDEKEIRERINEIKQFQAGKISNEKTFANKRGTG